MPACLGQGNTTSITFPSFRSGWPRSDGGLRPGDVILATASWAVWGLRSLPCPHPSLAGGTRASRTGTAAAVLRSLPAHGNFVFYPLKPHSHCSSSHAKPGRLYYILLYFPFQKTVTGSFSTSATLPAKSISPFSSLPGKVTGIPPCMMPCQCLALLPTRMLPRCNPSLPAAPKDSKVSREAIHLLAAD